MNLRPAPGARHPGYPRNAPDEPNRGQVDHDPRPVRVAFEHEHSRAYDACETAAQRLEIAGHYREAALVRAIRRRMAEDLERGRCERRHQDVVDPERPERRSPEPPPQLPKRNDYGPDLVARAED